MDRMSFVRCGFGAGLGLAMGGGSGARHGRLQTPVRIQRLSWAGIRLETDSHTLLLDPWEDLSSFPGPVLGRSFPIEVSTARRYVALSHLHNDHFDRTTLRRLYDEDGARGSVVSVRSMATDIAGAGLPTRTTDLWEPQILGPFTALPVPGVDGFGGEQVSWIVRVGGRTLFHGGDGLWHGRLAEYAAMYGPFDAAFLTINGVTTPAATPPVRTSRTLGPVEAAEAALALDARILVPIHYGAHVPGDYEEVSDAPDVARRAAADRGLAVQLASDGDWLDID